MIRVLFVCTANAARSQMAEALLGHLGAGRFVVASGGSHPADRISRLSIETLREHGIAWERRMPKPVEDFEDDPWDVVITLCDHAREHCPVFPHGRAMAHWSMPDPGAVLDPDARRAAFRDAFQVLRARIERLIALPLASLDPIEMARAVDAIGRVSPTGEARQGFLIRTERLELVPATVESTQAALDGPGPLADALGAAVPDTWPPEFLDEPALQFTRARLAHGSEHAGWWLYFVVLPDGPTGRTLIGSAGYKGPPSADGTVEVGYGIVSDQRRRGYASEATRGLIARAFAQPAVRRVIAETFPELTPSIGVLRTCGFRFIGDGSEPGVIRFELTRAEYTTGGAPWPS